MKRFWTSAEAVATAGGFAIAVDGRGVKTPARADLQLPTEALSLAIAISTGAYDATGNGRRDLHAALQEFAGSSLDLPADAAIGAYHHDQHCSRNDDLDREPASVLDRIRTHIGLASAAAPIAPIHRHAADPSTHRPPRRPELSDALLARTNAEAQLVQAEFQLATARSKLLRALGRS